MKVQRILSLDGGGMKGLFSAYFMKWFCQDAGIPGNEIYKHFDIISGTSIGGIQALAYSYGFSPDEMIEMFESSQNPLDNGNSNPNSIFYPPASTITKINSILYGEATWYSNANLQALIDLKFGNTRMYELKTNALITSVEISIKQIPDVGTSVTTYRPVLFSNLNTTGVEGQSYRVRDVALATSAAPIFFPAVSIPEVTTVGARFIDGGVYQNNPSALNWALSNVINPSANRVCVLSVGTGLGTVGIFDPVPVPPPEEIQGTLDEFKEFLTTKNYSDEQITAKLKSILPDFNNVYLLLDLISLGIGGPQEAIARQLLWQSLYGAKINNKDLFSYRFNTNYDPNQDTELDNTSAEFIAYMQKAANAQYQKDILKIRSFIQKMNI